MKEQQKITFLSIILCNIESKCYFHSFNIAQNLNVVSLLFSVSDDCLFRSGLNTPALHSLHKSKRQKKKKRFPKSAEFVPQF